LGMLGGHLGVGCLFSWARICVVVRNRDEFTLQK
jgi:hypothetical protein